MKKGITINKNWFIVSLLISILALTAAIFSGVSLWCAWTQPRDYIVAPGNTEIYFDKAGTINIYYEYTIASQLNEAVTFYFSSVETGHVVESRAAWINETYSFGRTKGILVAKVDLPQPGSYLISSSYTKEEQQLQFMVGRNFVLGIVLLTFVAIFGSIGCYFGFGISIIFFVIVRENAKNQAPNADKYVLN